MILISVSVEYAFSVMWKLFGFVHLLLLFFSHSSCIFCFVFFLLQLLLLLLLFLFGLIVVFFPLFSFNASDEILNEPKNLER